MNTIEVRVPDIGDFKDVEIIEVLVKPGDVIKPEDSLIALESDKATMEIPSPAAGTVKQLKIKVGDRVSQGSMILMLETSGATVSAAKAPSAPAAAPAPAVAETPAAPPIATPAAPVPIGNADLTTQVVVLGAGPGGYTAAFRAADLGLQVTLIERYATLGGVCLNVGCIPSKALLHVAKVVTEAQDAAAHGVNFGKPSIDFAKVQSWKSEVVSKLTKGLSGLAKQRKVNVVQGTAKFTSPKTLQIETAQGVKTLVFEHAIIAAGSMPARFPNFPWDDPRLLDSTRVLALTAIPKRMLVVGGGIIGLEIATVYDALGTKVSVVELMDSLIPGCDSDLVRPLAKRIGTRYEKIMLKTKVSKIESQKNGLKVHFEGDGAIEPQLYDAVLVAVGRRPNGNAIGAQAAGVMVNERGFIPVDAQQRTNVSHIYAIGDIVGEPMLAHKATHEGKVAAEVISGHKAAFDAKAIPSVAYTDPEIAWMGLSELEAKKRGVEVEVGSFPWAASGRALGQARDEGVTKLVIDKATRRILGAGMTGPSAGELIAEAVLALEMGADAADLSLTIHPHPTLSETVAFAAEILEGSITDLLPPRKAR